MQENKKQKRDKHKKERRKHEDSSGQFQLWQAVQRVGRSSSSNCQCSNGSSSIKACCWQSGQTNAATASYMGAEHMLHMVMARCVSHYQLCASVQPRSLEVT